MKIYFANYRSGTEISIRAAINALLNWHKVERAQTVARKKNVPQMASGWDYRPRKANRAYPGVDCASAETSDVLNPELSAINEAWRNTPFRRTTKVL